MRRSIECDFKKGRKKIDIDTHNAWAYVYLNMMRERQMNYEIVSNNFENLIFFMAKACDRRFVRITSVKIKQDKELLR